MDFETFTKINDDRKNYREMTDASVISSYRNTGCGDGYRIYLKIESDTITDASYTTTGCGFGLVSLAVATEWSKGKTLERVAQMDSEDIEKEFEFPPRRKNYPESAAECLRKAVADYRNGTGIPKDAIVPRLAVLEKLKKQKHLRNESLQQVSLEGTDLSGIDLSGADLAHSFLTNTNFSNANLQKTSLKGAFLNQSNLEGANLSGADLRWAKLTGVIIDEHTQFDGALYDVGTRIDAKHIELFQKMRKHEKTRDIYIDKTAE